MALIQSLESLIQTKYMPVLYDNIFKKSHPLASILKGKAKTFNGREIGVPLEHATATDGNVKWGSPGVAVAPAVTDPFTLAKYTPAMLTGTIKINHEEFLVMNSKEAVKNIVDAKVKNLQKTLEQAFASALWTTTANAWSAMPKLLSSTGTIGGIAIADMAGWATPVINAESLNGDGALDYADLVASSQDTYLPKMLARGVANAKAQTGEDPDIILMSQYNWDVLESILDPQKTGNKFNARLGSMGFTALDFRGIAVVADADLASAFTGDGDNKSRIYFINTDYLYMFFNSGAKFTAAKFIESDTSNTHSMKVHTYGNLVTSNRGAHCVIDNVYSDGTYV